MVFVYIYPDDVASFTPTTSPRYFYIIVFIFLNSLSSYDEKGIRLQLKTGSSQYGFQMSPVRGKRDDGVDEDCQALLPAFEEEESKGTLKRVVWYFEEGVVL